MGRDYDRILSAEGISELSGRLGLEAIEEFDVSAFDVRDEVSSEQTSDDPAVITEEPVDQFKLDYPWPVTIVSAYARYETDGSYYTDIVIEFDDIPGANNYEYRIVAV